MSSPCARIDIFHTSTVNARNILFFRTGKKGNRLEGSENQSTLEGQATEWPKTLRLPRTPAAGRHTKTRDRRAHHHESGCHRMFFGFLMRQHLIDYVRHWSLYGCVVYPSRGTATRNCSRHLTSSLAQSCCIPTSPRLTPPPATLPLWALSIPRVVGTRVYWCLSYVM